MNPRASFKLSAVLALSLVASSLLAPVPVFGARLAAQGDAAARQEWEALRLRLLTDPRSVNLLVSGVWGLTHSSGSDAEVKALLTLVAVVDEPFERQQVGGAAGFKEKVAGFLKSEGDAVRGFAATVLAAVGDKSYAPRVAALLDRAEPPDGAEPPDAPHPLTSPGRAAVALALLGAREHTTKFASMLRSPNMYDRRGAAYALGILGAKEHAKAVAAMLTDERFKFYDRDAPIHALFQMGVAADYADLFAAVVRAEDTDSETAKAAAYALAALKSKRHAKDVARLLEKKYVRGDAAKALAVMGAKEYAPRIARLLRDEGSLDQCAALLALGVLGAREYAPTMVRIMRRQKKSFVSNYAAQALVLLGATEYAAEVVPLVEPAYAQKAYVTAGNFDPLVEDALEPLRRRYEKSFLKMRARLVKR
jgi:HEAT repeat protein